MNEQVLIMKMHSYMAVNGTLATIAHQSKRLASKLRKETERVGGYDAALLAAKSHREELDAKNGSTTSSGANTPIPIGTPDMPADAQTSYMDAPAAIALRNRLVNGKGAPAESDVSDSEKDSANPLTPHPLVDHPDTTISSLAQELTEYDSELVSPGPQRVHWPENISLRNFADYMLIPTLVYELEYPRTNKYATTLSRVFIDLTKIDNNRIRPLYIFEKTVATFGTFALLYSITETFILPYSGGGQSFFMALLDLALPFMVAYLLLFFIIFGKNGDLYFNINI
jgi:sterol O-acyltransferase